uniref:Putative secreted protein n=1 Tax=Amblyomma americanum TaxID=6943 RepID=A0A0C9S3Y2_AMBAM
MHNKICMRIVVKIVVFKSVHSFFLAAHSSSRIEHAPQVRVFHAPRLALVADTDRVEGSSHFAPGLLRGERFPFSHLQCTHVARLDWILNCRGIHRADNCHNLHLGVLGRQVRCRY